MCVCVCVCVLVSGVKHSDSGVYVCVCVYYIVFQILSLQLAFTSSDTALLGSQAQDRLSMPHCYKYHSAPRRTQTASYTHIHT